MDKKKIIIIGLIIIILASCLIIITSQDNTVDSDNYNQTKSNISNDTTKNDSLNANQIIKSGIYNNQTSELGEKSIYSSSSINTKNHLSNDKTKLVEVTADDIKKLVEEYVNWQNPITGGAENEVVIGEPYKRHEGNWLVPAFNKNTGEFIGAVWVGAVKYKDDDGSFSHGFINGPDSYSVYKDIISGKDVDGGGDFSYDSIVLIIPTEPSDDDSNQVSEEIEQVSDLNNSTS